MWPPPNSSAESTYFRTRDDAKEAIRGAQRTREMARSTRLRLRLDAIADLIRDRAPGGRDDRAKMLPQILDAVMAATDAPMGNIQLVERNALRIRAHTGFAADFLEFFAEVRDAHSACGVAFQSGAPVVVENVEQSEIYTELARRAMLDAGARAVQSLALTGPRAQQLGVISVHYSTHGISRVRQDAFAACGDHIARAVALCLHG